MIGAACLAAAFVASLATEALDADLDLWPDGAENFTPAPQGSTATGSLTVGTLAALVATSDLVFTAGAHLVLRHRARSALATDRPPLLTPLNVAEPWRQDLNDAPVLGHFFSWRPGENWNGSARTRPTRLSPLSRTFPLAGSVLVPSSSSLT